MKGHRAVHLLIADDHALFRDTLVQYLERADPRAVISTAKDFYEAVEILKRDQNMDLVLMDLHMPGMQGVGGLEKLFLSFPDVPVAIISGTAERKDVERALSLGAAGYLPKTLPGKDLIKGIAQILSGEIYVAVNEDTRELLPSHYGDVPPGMEGSLSQLEAGFPKLTPREREVLSFLVRGVSNKEIANAMGLQVVTVKLHVRGICRKLEVANRTQAALKAQQLGLSAAATL